MAAAGLAPRFNPWPQQRPARPPCALRCQRRHDDTQLAAAHKCRCLAPQGAEAPSCTFADAPRTAEHSGREQHAHPKQQGARPDEAAPRSSAAGRQSDQAGAQVRSSQASAPWALPRIDTREWPRALVASSVAPALLLALQQAGAGAPPEAFPVGPRSTRACA